ncbi:MAG: hypothetical protein ACLR76_00720 [Alistipes sp.]
MKKLLFILLSMMSVSAALQAGNEIRTTDPQKLPATAREFIATHFPDTRIALIKIDREGGRTDRTTFCSKTVPIWNSTAGASGPRSTPSGRPYPKASFRSASPTT